MTDHSDLVARLRTTWPLEGVGPITREQRERIHEAAALIETQAATIEALRAELAGRDAEIAAWLRGQDHVRAGTYIGEVYKMLATAIASGAYRETGNE